MLHIQEHICMAVCGDGSKVNTWNMHTRDKCAEFVSYVMYFDTIKLGISISSYEYILYINKLKIINQFNHWKVKKVIRTG